MDEAIKIVGQCSRNCSEKFKMDIFVAKLEELPIRTQNLLVYILVSPSNAQPPLECTSRKNTPKFLRNFEPRVDNTWPYVARNIHVVL